jgi:hypothetical protein
MPHVPEAGEDILNPQLDAFAIEGPIALPSYHQVMPHVPEAGEDILNPQLDAFAIEVFLDVSFSMRSVSYQMKVGD